MPTYLYRCEECCIDQEVWESIHADARTTGDCGHSIIRVITNVRTLNIGPQAKSAITADATEAQWAKDMPAYKRFRKAGHQPPGIDGCDKLEATAHSDLEIKSGGRIKVSDQHARESQEQARDIIQGRL